MSFFKRKGREAPLSGLQRQRWPASTPAPNRAVFAGRFQAAAAWNLADGAAVLSECGFPAAAGHCGCPLASLASLPIPTASSRLMGKIYISMQCF